MKAHHKIWICAALAAACMVQASFAETVPKTVSKPVPKKKAVKPDTDAPPYAWPKQASRFEPAPEAHYSSKRTVQPGFGGQGNAPAASGAASVKDRPAKKHWWAFWKKKTAKTPPLPENAAVWTQTQSAQETQP